MDGSARILIIDEFDNQKGSRGTQEKQEEVLTMLRTASGGDGVFLQGTTSGRPRKYRFSVSTMLAGIDPEMTEANQTRLITTDLKSGLDGRLPPQHVIINKWSKEKIKEQRRLNTLSIFAHIPKILSAYSEVQKAVLDDPNIFGEDVMQRFKESLGKIVCVFKAAYPESDEWIRVGRTICDAKKLKLDALKSATANADLIDSLLYSHGVEVSNALEKKVYSIIQIITSDEILADPMMLNSSNVGAWFQPSTIVQDGEEVEKFYLFVEWRIIKSTLFKYIPRWKNQAPSQLKMIAGRHPKVLKENQALEIYKKEKDIPSWVAGSIEKQTFSVVDITDLVVSSKVRSDQAHSYATSPEFQNSLPATKVADDPAGNYGNI
jgi:hypothetical protein